MTTLCWILILTRVGDKLGVCVLKLQNENQIKENEICSGNSIF